MQWDELRKRKTCRIFPSLRGKILQLFSLSFLLILVTRQLWLKTFLNVFRDRQNSLSWAASPTRLPCTPEGRAGTKSTGQETWSTGNLNVLLIEFGCEPFYSSLFHWCIYLNALRTRVLSQQGFAECIAGGILTLFGTFCFLRMK